MIPIDISNGSHRRLELTVTLISCGLRAAIIHSSIRVRPIHCSYPQACSRQGTAYTYTRGSLPSPCACSRNAASCARDTLVVQSTGRKSCIKGHSRDDPTCYICWTQVQNKSCLFRGIFSHLLCKSRAGRARSEKGLVQAVERTQSMQLSSAFGGGVKLRRKIAPCRPR